MDLSRKGPVMSNPPRLDPIGSRPEFVTQSKERSFGQRMSEAGGSRKTKIKPDMFKGNVDMVSVSWISLKYVARGNVMLYGRIIQAYTLLTEGHILSVRELPWINKLLYY